MSLQRPRIAFLASLITLLVITVSAGKQTAVKKAALRNKYRQDEAPLSARFAERAAHDLHSDLTTRELESDNNAWGSDMEMASDEEGRRLSWMFGWIANHGKLI
jgi:hypothetical protein